MRFSQPLDDPRAGRTRNDAGFVHGVVHSISARPQRGPQALLLLCLALCALLPAGSTRAQGPLLSDQRLQQEAMGAVPLDEMNQTVRTKLSRVMSNPTLFRRLPTTTIDCDPDMYVFLVRYPEVIVNIWQLMGITKVQMTRTGDYTFDAADGAGTVSKIELAYGRPDIHVFYADGVYEGPLLRNRMTGSCVAVLHSGYERQDDRVMVSNYMDVFVRLDNVGAELLVKALQPLFGKAADYNFVESSKFLGQVSLASELNGPGMQRLAGKLNNCGPQVRQAFADQSDAVYQRAVLERNPGTLSEAEGALPRVGLSPSIHPSLASPLPSSASAPLTPRDHQPVYRR